MSFVSADLTFFYGPSCDCDPPSSELELLSGRKRRRVGERRRGSEKFFRGASGRRGGKKGGKAVEKLPVVLKEKRQGLWRLKKGVGRKLGGRRRRRVKSFNRLRRGRIKNGGGRDRRKLGRLLKTAAPPTFRSRHNKQARKKESSTKMPWRRETRCEKKRGGAPKTSTLLFFEGINKLSSRLACSLRWNLAPIPLLPPLPSV